MCCEGWGLGGDERRSLPSRQSIANPVMNGIEAARTGLPFAVSADGPGSSKLFPVSPGAPRFHTEQPTTCCSLSSAPILLWADRGWT